jgi:uncharacterized protein (TIGR03382 family)
MSDSWVRLPFAWLLTLGVLLTAPPAAQGQGYDSHMHTGNAVLDLTTDPATVICPVGLTAFEGTSTWSDPVTGSLRFFTDGISIYDASTGLPVSGGSSSLGGTATATQTSFLAPVPGTLNEQLYIFSNDTDNVLYSVLDDSGPAPVMAVTAQLLVTDTGEAVSGLDDGEGGFWLVVWNERGATLDSYRVTDEGIGLTPASSPLPWTNLSASRGTIVFTRTGDRVAVTTEDGAGLVWADFDRPSGLVTSPWTQVHTRQGYSVAWSPDGSQLYYVSSPSTWGWSGSLYQFDTATGAETNLGGSGLSGVMLGSDNTLWICGYGDTVLGQVVDPDVGGAANTDLAAVSLEGCVAGYNLSNQVALNEVLCLDEDGDGYLAMRCNGTDCNDDDPNTYPGAPELCDGIDNDCDLELPEEELDLDGDGVLACDDPCPLDNPDDTDGDGVCDSDDECPGGDDLADADGDGTADFCDPCPNDDPDDSDDDGVCDSDDICPGGDDTVDTDGDGTPDFCDDDPDTADDDDGDDDDGDGDGDARATDCTCSSSTGGGAGTVAILAFALLGRGRRRRY